MLVRSRATLPLMLLILLALVCLLVARADAAMTSLPTGGDGAAGPGLSTSTTHLLHDLPAGDGKTCAPRLSPAGRAEGFSSS
jgi:hypothetical protein